MDAQKTAEKAAENPAAVKAGKKRTAKRPAAPAKAAKRSRKPAKKAALKAKPLKKRGRKTGRRGRRPSAGMAARGMTPRSAPTMLLLGQGGKVEPAWIKYAQMSPTKPTRRPGVPTDIRIGNLVGWKTENGKERIGVVQQFLADAAIVGMGGRNETIRIARLTKLAEKVKEL